MTRKRTRTRVRRLLPHPPSRRTHSSTLGLTAYANVALLDTLGIPQDTLGRRPFRGLTTAEMDDRCAKALPQLRLASSHLVTVVRKKNCVAKRDVTLPRRMRMWRSPFTLPPVSAKARRCTRQLSCEEPSSLLLLTLAPPKISYHTKPPCAAREAFPTGKHVCGCGQWQ